MTYKVSILARLNGRALPAELEEFLLERGVSILARLNGRALRWRGKSILRRVTVSILARLNGRALHGVARPVDEAIIQFQSSPGLMAGRYLNLLGEAAALQWFQSSPGLMAGRYHHLSVPLAVDGRCFNPRPA